MAEIEPTGAELLSEHLLAITWSDGRTLHYPLDHLRAECPCAHCSPTFDERPRLTREAFAGITLRNLEEVGSYALRIAFSDGHEMGIYTWGKLLAIGFPEGQAPPPVPPPEAFDV